MPFHDGRMQSRGSKARLSVLLLAALAIQGLPTTAWSDDPIWTDKPVRIDRSKQDYERVAVERRATPLGIRISSRVTVFDSTSFRENGRIHVLTAAVPVNPRRLCRSADGRIAACGQQARIHLRRLIANRTLQCTEDFRTGEVSFLSCDVGGRDLARSLVASGAAWTATPQLAAAQAEAMRQGLGIWIDAECRPLGRCPPEGQKQ